jgi:hypothetical protein
MKKLEALNGPEDKKEILHETESVCSALSSGTIRSMASVNPEQLGINVSPLNNE